MKIEKEFVAVRGQCLVSWEVGCDDGCKDGCLVGLKIICSHKLMRQGEANY
jgi:hypothetical protein